MRHEKKYRIEHSSESEIKQLLLSHPDSFSTAFPDRHINSIYFDTAALTSFQQNQDGISQRTKYRIRWYGDSLSQISSPQLEIKIRDNEFGTKDITPLADFDLSQAHQLEAIAKKHIPLELMPKVITRYKRAYYISHNQILRATVDTAVTYHGFGKYQYKTVPHLDPAIILELKCAKEEVSFLSDACQHIPYRIQKNSKYVNGVFKTRS